MRHRCFCAGLRLTCFCAEMRHTCLCCGEKTHLFLGGDKAHAVEIPGQKVTGLLLSILQVQRVKSPGETHIFMK